MPKRTICAGLLVLLRRIAYFRAVNGLAIHC